MKAERLAIADLLLIEPTRFGDDRGFFSEVFSRRALAAHGITADFVQDNHSLSRQKGVVRGLHFQRPPSAQGKLVRVTEGEVFDVVVDIRPDSPTRGQWVGERLSADNKRQMWVYPGLAHGFLVLSEHAEFLYKTTDYWYPAHERSLLWSDPDLAIAWPTLSMAPLLAAKDAQAPKLAQAEVFV